MGSFGNELSLDFTVGAATARSAVAATPLPSAWGSLGKTSTQPSKAPQSRAATDDEGETSGSAATQKLGRMEELGVGRETWQHALSIATEIVLSCAPGAREINTDAAQRLAAIDHERWTLSCAASLLLLGTRLVPWTTFCASPMLCSSGGYGGGMPAVKACQGDKSAVLDTLSTLRTIARVAVEEAVDSARGGDTADVVARYLALHRDAAAGAAPGAPDLQLVGSAGLQQQAAAFVRLLIPALKL